MDWRRTIGVAVVGVLYTIAVAASASDENGTAFSAGDEPHPPQVVLVAPVEGMIDLGLSPFIGRVLERAARERAAAVVLEVNTLGGRLDAAVLIRDQFLKSPIRTIAFVDKRAISAGALVTLAAQEIVLAPGATIGAATPVKLAQGGERGETADEKTISYVRKEFRATAEEPSPARQRGRTLTPLRPAGTAAFDGERVDVVSEGDFLDAGEAVEVVRRDGNRVVVRRGRTAQ